MHIKKNKLILFIILISITDFSFAEKAPFESTYEALPPTNTIFRNANVYDGEGNEFSEIDLLPHKNAPRNNKTFSASANEKMQIRCIDYYYSNAIARASKTMSDCRNINMNNKKNGTNN